MFYEDHVRAHQRIIIWCWPPAQLGPKWRHSLIVAFDQSDGVKCWGNPIDTFHLPVRWGEGGLDVDNKKCLFHALH